MSWGSFFWGAAAFAALSLVLNLFDEEFREALARLITGLVLGPFFLVGLAVDRFGPKGQRVSVRALQRFSSAGPNITGWVMSYRKRGILIVRSSSLTGRSAPEPVLVTPQVRTTEEGTHG